MCEIFKQSNDGYYLHHSIQSLHVPLILLFYLKNQSVSTVFLMRPQKSVQDPLLSELKIISRLEIWDCALRKEVELNFTALITEVDYRDYLEGLRFDSSLTNKMGNIP